MNKATIKPISSFCAPDIKNNLQLRKAMNMTLIDKCFPKLPCQRATV